MREVRDIQALSRRREAGTPRVLVVNVNKIHIYEVGEPKKAQNVDEIEMWAMRTNLQRQFFDAAMNRRLCGRCQKCSSIVHHSDDKSTQVCAQFHDGDQIRDYCRF